MCEPEQPPQKRHPALLALPHPVCQPRLAATEERHAGGAALARIWPIDLVTQVAAEARTVLRHFQSWRSNRSAFRGRSDLRLKVGCGNNVISDWINIDVAKRPGVLYWDCPRSLPFDASVAVIFAEHVFEHF